MRLKATIVEDGGIITSQIEVSQFAEAILRQKDIEGTIEKIEQRQGHIMFVLGEILNMFAENETMDERRFLKVLGDHETKIEFLTEEETT